VPEVRVLGPIEVLGDDGQLVAIGGPQPQRLVAALALLEAGGVGTARLTEAVWPDDAYRPEEPRNSLQAYISRLRGGGLSIERAGDGYALGADVDVDSRQFTSQVDRARVLAERGDHGAAVAEVSEALVLWQGEVAGGFGDEEWALSTCAHLSELRLQANEHRVGWRLEGGDIGTAVAEAVAICVEHPLRERPHRLLMQAHYAAGDSVEALRVFQVYRARLAEEVGLEPSRDLVELERGIAAGTTVAAAAPTRRLGSYQLGELIGEGAFGAIYRATQPSVGREVAIKVVRPELANDPQFVRRFEVEAQTVARLEHPHIVPLYDYWRDPSGAYLVMRYLAGGSAEQRLMRDGPWALTDVARLVEEIGPALAVAHEASVLHRDIKPANVLFDEAGNSYLADFGIATDVGSREATDLRSAGSPLYVSPEQVRDGEATPASDVYGFGVMLYELLTGAAPFADSDSVEALLERKVRERVPSLLASRLDLPEAIDLLVQTATAPTADQRFQSMGELVLAFRTAATDQLPGAGTTEAHEGVSSRPRVQAAHTLVGLELESANPYKGLAAFGEPDASDFFGRGALTTEIVERLEGTRFLVVTGPSGSGKSSVVRAGVLPRLRERGALVASIVPGTHPMDELETALLRLATQPTGALLEQLTADERGLGRAVKTLLPDDETELVLVIDQLEELFTQTPHERRDTFLAAVASAVADERSRLRVVCTLRADFYDRPLQHPAISEIVRTNTLAVTPLTGEELDEAITRPASSVGVTVEPALVAELLTAASGQAAGLPLLQYALTETYERRSGGRMTMEAYRSIGGILGALASRADELFDELGTDEQAGVQRLFTRMVTPGEGTEDTRRRALRSELSGVPANVIDGYGAARLLTFDRDPSSREPTVEVAHEALIREWPRLRSWLDDDRDGLRILRHLGASAEAWEASSREAGELYRGGRLEEAEGWAAEHTADLTPLEGSFLEASIVVRAAEEASERRRVRRLRSLLLGTAVVAVIALIAGVVAVQQRGEARDQREVAFENAASAKEHAAAAEEQAALADDRATAEATARSEADAAKAEATAAHAAAVTERLAAEGVARVTDNPQLALLLASEAYRRDPAVETLGAVQRALIRTGPYMGTLGAGREFSEVEWLDDDRILAMGPDGVFVFGSNGTLIASNASAPLTRSGLFDTKVIASVDANTVAFASAEQPDQLEILDVSTAAVITRVDHPEPVDAVLLDPSGDVVYTLDLAGYLRRIDVRSGKFDWEVYAHPEDTNEDLPPIRDGTVHVIFGTELEGGGPSLPNSFQPQLLAFSHDGLSLVSANATVIRSWDPVTGDRLTSDERFYTRTDAGSLTGFKVDRFVISETSGDILILWRHLLSRWRIGEPEMLSTVVVETSPGSPPNPLLEEVVWDGGDTAIVLFSDGRVGVVSLLDGSLQGVGALPVPGPRADDLAVSDDGTRVAVATAEGVALLSLDGDRLIATGVPRLGAESALFDPATSMLSTIDANLVTFGSTRGRWWRMGDGEPSEVEVPLPHKRSAWPHRSGMLMATTDDYQPSLHNPDTLDEIASFSLPFTWTSEDMNREQSLIAFGGVLGTEVFDTTTGEHVVILDDTGPFAQALSWSMDGEYLAASSRDGFAVIWRTDTWELATTAYPLDEVRSVRFSEDGRWLATAGVDGRVRLLDTEGFGVTHELSTRLDPFTGSTFGFIGSDYLLTIGKQGAELWHIDANVRVGDPFPTAPDFAAAEAGTSRLITGTEEHILLWDIDPESWPKIACQAAGRNMTLDEWEQFVPPGEPYQPTCPQWPARG